MNRWFSVLIFLIIAVGISCDSDLSSKVQYKYKKYSGNGIVAKLGDIEVKEDEAFSDIQSEIFEKELELFELKFNKIKSILLERLIKKDPKSKGLTVDAYLAKYIIKVKKPTKSEIKKFFEKMKIPKQYITPQYKERVKEHLVLSQKREAVEKWLARKSAKNPIEIFMVKPLRPVVEVKVGNAPTFGNKNAKVTIIEFSDFQCPHCKKGADLISQIKEKYGKKVLVAFKQFPLPFHPQAKLAAEATLCARSQGVKYFWKMHDALFADQSKFAAADIKATAKRIGLKKQKFANCLDGHQYAQAVESDIEEGKKIGVKATPTFFINGRLISGAGSFSSFQEIIDEFL